MESWFKFSAAQESNSALQPASRLQVASQLSCTAVPGFGAAAAALLTAPGTLCLSWLANLGRRRSCLLHAHSRSPVGRKVQSGNLAELKSVWCPNGLSRQLFQHWPHSPG